MKQQEKTKRTRERILAASIREFGTKSYEAASVNAICSESHLSKGLIYHNFKSKDELYLECVKICYEKMTEYLKANEPDLQDIRQNLQSMLEVRQKFFSENPHYANIFFHSVLQPPGHLLPDLQEIRREYDEFYTGRYRNLLHRLPLREGITEDIALEYFSIFVEMFNSYFQKRAAQGRDYHDLIEDHEGKLSGILDIMLYGMAAPKGGE